MRRFFGYIGAALIWLGERADTRHKQETFREILFGVNLPESEFSKIQDRPVAWGILYTVAIFAMVILTILFF
jgi:hypothetical protein